MRVLKTSLIGISISVILSSFVMSYGVLKAEAQAHGVSNGLSYAFPIVIDALMIVGHAYLVYCEAKQLNKGIFSERNQAIFIILMGTAASLYFNWLHAVNSAAIPFFIAQPIVNLICSHVIASVVRIEVENKQDSLEKQVNDLTRKLKEQSVNFEQYKSRAVAQIDTYKKSLDDALIISEKTNLTDGNSEVIIMIDSLINNPDFSKDNPDIIGDLKAAKKLKNPLRKLQKTWGLKTEKSVTNKLKKLLPN